MFFEGTIGVNLLSDIESIDSKIGGIRTLVVDSNGGLVGEAIAVAEFLETRKITVISRNNCDSACIILAIASPRSFAERDLKFGFHGVTSIIDSSDEAVLVAQRNAAEQSQTFMLAHHIPQEIVDQSKSIPQDQLIYVPAAVLAKAGAISGLVAPGVVEPDPAGAL